MTTTNDAPAPGVRKPISEMKVGDHVIADTHWMEDRYQRGVIVKLSPPGWVNYRNDADGEVWTTDPSNIRIVDAPAPAPSGSGVREALRPFAHYAAHPIFKFIHENAPGDMVVLKLSGDPGDPASKVVITVEDFRKAARILSALASDASPRGEATEIDIRREAYLQGWRTALAAHPAPATVGMREAVRIAEACLANVQRIRREASALQSVAACVDADGRAKGISEVLDALRTALAPATETEGRHG